MTHETKSRNHVRDRGNDRFSRRSLYALGILFGLRGAGSHGFAADDRRHLKSDGTGDLSTSRTQQNSLQRNGPRADLHEVGGGAAEIHKPRRRSKTRHRKDASRMITKFFLQASAIFRPVLAIASGTEPIPMK